MPDTVVRVEHLAKRYRIAHQPSRERYVSLRDVLTARFMHAGRSIMRNCRSILANRTSGRPEQIRGTVERPTEDFWALSDISFDISRGDVLGVIGRNGAGKSTLLKVLSRITEPTRGRVRIKGRVASLLEVGTGFHPELTGRENIFLNGAILGMSRVEIRQKFDEIVAFAEIEQFLDIPVKRYSSGMYVRLAFAVAAHLEPEILIVDEVLAVGDSHFQKRCLGKMSQIATGGRTVIFVSHNMAAIKSLTSQAIVLHRGRLEFIGMSHEAVEYYSRALDGAAGTQRRFGAGVHTAIESVRLLNGESESLTVYTPGTPFTIEVTFVTDGKSPMSLDSILLDSNRAQIGLASLSHFHGITLPDRPGRYVCRLTLEPLWLASGMYTIDLTTCIVNQCWDHYVEDALKFEVITCNPLGFPWDFKCGYGYGALAMLCTQEPQFETIGLNDNRPIRASSH
jgi:lipopolysaccharide transport system ATP-binding protein